MTPAPGTAALVLQRLNEILTRLARLEERSTRMEEQLAQIAEDTDQIDLLLRPHGDHTRLSRRRRRDRW